MTETTSAEVIEVSLVKTIETKLVQANVTDQVISALKEKYAGLKLASLNDKESYLEIKAAAKECAKVRTLTVKICKEGREEAVKAQKQWITKEKEVVGQIAEVENVLDAEVAKFDAEVERLATEEKNRQEAAYINRQAVLAKMGAIYQDGSFVLREVSFEANLIKSSSDEVWEQTIVPKFDDEYQKIEAVKIESERNRKEQEAEVLRQQAEIKKQQDELRAQQEEFARQQAESVRAEQEKARAEQLEKQRIEREKEFEEMKLKAAANAEQKRIADVEKAKNDAILAEQKRNADEIEAKKQAEIKKQAELEAAGDKVKWQDFLSQLSSVTVFDMKSGLYRRKMAIAKEKIEEILAL